VLGVLQEPKTVRKADMSKEDYQFPHVPDVWFAWRPVPLWDLGNIMEESVEESLKAGGRWAGDRTHWRTTGKWAWWRNVERIRGIYLEGRIYIEIVE